MTMPTVRFGEYDVSRLIIGGNPFRGNSHLSDELNADMWDYHGSGETVIESWFEAEKHGVTAMQARGDQFIMDWVDRYREQGGKLHWFVQTASEWKGGDVPDNIHTLAKHGPIGIYHHGSLTDSLWKSGEIDKVKEYHSTTPDQRVLPTHPPFRKIVPRNYQAIPGEYAQEWHHRMTEPAESSCSSRDNNEVDDEDHDRPGSPRNYTTITIQ